MKNYFNRISKGKPLYYNGRNFVIIELQRGKEGEPVFIGCTDFSITDPYINIQRHLYTGCTELALYFKDDADEQSDVNLEYKGCKGLESAAEELAEFINQLNEHVVLEFLCKSALMLHLPQFVDNMINKEKVHINALYVPFLGTCATERHTLMMHLNDVQFAIAEFFSSHHQIDDEIRRDSALLKKVVSLTDDFECFYYSATLNSKTKIYYFTKPKGIKNSLMTCFFKFLGKKLEKVEGVTDSNGLVTLKSQEHSLKVPSECVRLYDSMAHVFYHKQIVNDIQKVIDYAKSSL